MEKTLIFRVTNLIMEITNIILEETYIRDGITKCRDTTLKTLQNQKYTPKTKQRNIFKNLQLIQIFFFLRNVSYF